MPPFLWGVSWRDFLLGGPLAHFTVNMYNCVLIENREFLPLEFLLESVLPGSFFSLPPLHGSFTVMFLSKPQK